MRKTPALEDLAQFLQDATVDFNSLTILYKSHPHYEEGRELKFSEYERAYKDNFLKFQLERARHQGYGIQDCILKAKKRLVWQYDPSKRVHVFKTAFCEKLDDEDHEFTLDEKEEVLVPLSTYENLIKLEGLPTIVESCMGRFTPQRRIKFQIKLLRTLLANNRFGYLIYAPKEYLIAKTAKKFEKKGGVIACFPLSKQEFREQLKETINRNNFRIKSTMPHSGIDRSLRGGSCFGCSRCSTS